MAAENSFTERCRQIAERLDRSAERPPREIEKAMDEIGSELARLRDDLIVQCRTHSDSGLAQRRLEYVNVALSLVVAVEYPATSVQRSALKQARETLENLLR